MTDLRQRVVRPNTSIDGSLQAAIDRCPEAIVITDEDARILMVNPVAANLLRMSSSELRRLTLWDISDTLSQPTFEILWREFRRKGRQTGLYAFRTPSGGSLEVAYCAHVNVCTGRNLFVFRPLP